MKRWLCRLLVTLVIGAGFIPLTAGASWACSCAGLSLSESQEWRSIANKAPRIYVGEVVRRTGGPVIGADGSVGIGQYRYELQVVSSLKGRVSGRQVAVTATQGSACGVLLSERRRLLVYSDQVSLCGGFTQERVPERAAIVRSAVRGDPVTHRVAPGEWLWKIARDELAVQSRSSSAFHSAPRAAAVQRAAQRLYAANRGVIGPDPARLRVGTRLVVPRLVP